MGMRITIVGGGNIGTQFAVHCAEKGHSVTIYTSKPEKFDKSLTIVNKEEKIIHTGKIKAATDDVKYAFENAELIFVTMPAYCMKDIADKIFPYVYPGMKICLVPGTGGGECAFISCANKGAVLFGMQRVPSVARLKEYGKCVRAVGYRELLHIAALPAHLGKECANIISNIFDIPCEVMGNYLNLTLTPSNPILHTTRLKTIFSNYKKGMTYASIPLFYEDWTDDTSELLFKCDEEVQILCKTLNMFELSGVKSLKIHYESDSPEALTRKIQSIEGFRGIGTPHITTEKGYIPDLDSRYFKADFLYGLTILIQIAELFEVPVPNMKETMEWYETIAGIQEGFAFKNYGIISKEDFLEFYSR